MALVAKTDREAALRHSTDAPAMAGARRAKLGNPNGAPSFRCLAKRVRPCSRPQASTLTPLPVTLQPSSPISARPGTPASAASRPNSPCAGYGRSVTGPGAWGK